MKKRNVFVKGTPACLKDETISRVLWVLSYSGWVALIWWIYTYGELCV